MYKAFFNLKENPFNVTSDSSFFFSSHSHTEAFSHLTFGIEQRKGIMTITGEVGTGKTTLCRTLMNRLDSHIKTALILNPKFSETELLQIILHDLGVVEKFKNKFSLIRALNEFLLSESSCGHNIVLIIDEAQNLKPNQLENIRLLSNLETEKEKLLQIILVGQPELEAKLRLPQLRQLNQRITVRYHIRPLSESELCEYILHRLKLASKQIEKAPNIQFSASAFEAIYHHSQGTPRVVNILCDRALLASFVNESRLVHDGLIHDCAKELFLQ